MSTDQKTKSPRVLLLRHGETDYAKNRFYADEIEDPPLNPLGIKQAQAWEGRLQNEGRKIAGIYVSPSRRTQETAKLASGKLGIRMETIEGLRERNFGAWGGLTPPEIKAQFLEEWKAWREDVVNFVPSGGESLFEFSIRVKETVRELISRHPEQIILAVTHVGPIRMLVSAAIGMPIVNFKRLIIANASITEIEFTDQWPNLHTLSYMP